MGETSIEWCEHSINPIRARHGDAVGHYCEKISPGCANCYSSTLQRRFRMPQFQHQRGEAVPFLDAKKLDEVLRRRKPTTYFWCDMTDMFGEWVPNEWIAACFGVMAATPHHTHQVLTKRAERMREWFKWVRDRCADHHGCERDTLHHAVAALLGDGEWPERTFDRWQEAFFDQYEVHHAKPGDPGAHWPLPNVWLGVSVEDQRRADRIDDLIETPAALRFVSAEPLLGPVHFTRWLNIPNTIDWIIIGGESGNGARPMNLAWARRIIADCCEADVDCFVKQLGAKPCSWALNAITGEETSWPLRLKSRKGNDMSEWPADLRVREVPS